MQQIMLLNMIPIQQKNLQQRKATKIQKQILIVHIFNNENDSYRIPTRAGYISTIILSPDEDIIHAEIGDATRWSIQTYYTGTSRGMSPAISIKPFIPELKTKPCNINNKKNV